MARIGGSSMIMRQALFYADEFRAIAAYESTVVWFDYGAQASVRVPEVVRARVRAAEFDPPQE